MGMFICLKRTTILAKYNAVAFEEIIATQIVPGNLLQTSDVVYGGARSSVIPPVVKNRHGDVCIDRHGVRKWMNLDHIRLAIWRGVLTIPRLVLLRNEATCRFLQENLSREMEIDQFTADMLELTFEPYSDNPAVFLNLVLDDSNRCLYRSFGQSQ